MKARLFITSVLISLVTVIPTWVSLQPLVRRAQEQGAAWQNMTTLLLSLDFVFSTVAVFILLHFTFGRPIERIEHTVRDLAREDDEGGALLLRLDRALRRLALELSEERRVNQQRLHELETSHDALVKLQAELVANDRLATVGKLASGVAHEVGNPLSGILGYLSVIRMRQPNNAEMLEVVSRIEHEVQRIDQIVRGLLELGRPSRGKAERMDVRPIIESSVKLLCASRDFENIQVGIEGPQSLWVRAESGPFSQVLVNLLLNAAQAMVGKGKVVVRLEPISSGAVVAVEDEGPGLTAQAQAHIFEPFFTTKAAGKGTGLGLAVSRHLLAQFEGQLEGSNKEGGGARFAITLPGP